MVRDAGFGASSGLKGGVNDAKSSASGFHFLFDCVQMPLFAYSTETIVRADLFSTTIPKVGLSEKTILTSNLFKKNSKKLVYCYVSQNRSLET